MVLRSGFRRIDASVHAWVDGWRTGSDRSQRIVLAVLLALVLMTFVVGILTIDLVPIPLWFVWLMAGVLLLRFRQLLLLSVVIVVAAFGAATTDGLDRPRIFTGLLTLFVSVAMVLFQSSRQRSGLPVALSEALLARLRDRLQAQSVVPPLPEGWRSESAMRTAHGPGYAGDFLVADLSPDESRLEMVLVDVCGKGVSVGPQALQFSGALGGLLGALPPAELMRAANSFLLRQQSNESLATAVHVLIDLNTGEYTITSAGHPPALRWQSEVGEWTEDPAHGTALGVIPDPEVESSRGVLAPGDALMFYTDGVVETREQDVETGINWLRTLAKDAVIAHGLSGVSRRIIAEVAGGDDDRAVLVLERGHRLTTLGRTTPQPGAQ